MSIGVVLFATTLLEIAMIEIVEVKTKKQQREFLNFPIKLYDGCPYYVPTLMIDEKKIFRKDYVYNETCDVAFFLAYEDGKVVGRISAIVQHASNDKWGQKRVRFTRFDCVDDQRVADALFDAATEWGKQLGMTEIVGPLGYSDLEREGMLIEGFDQFGTYEEQYNYDYYPKLVENYGFVKDVDWLEHKLYLPNPIDERFIEVSKRMLERNKCRMVRTTSLNKFLKQYGRQFFEIIDATYDRLYGTVPFTEKMMDVMVGNFKMIARPQDIALLVNEDDKVVGFAIMFPSISEAVTKSKGRLTLPFLFNFLKAKRHPKILDLGLIGVLPEYETRGIASVMIGLLMELIAENKDFDHLETNLTLEENVHILNMLKRFDKVFNKRRRCYKKDI